MAGLFITFEGGEGAGKSTHIKRLAERLKAQSREVLLTREPGGTPGGEAIRALVVAGDVVRWSAEAEALLNYAARDAHLREAIRPALARSAIVLSDRFMDSTRAYQGHAGGCDMVLIDELERAVVGATRPKLTLIFDLDPELGLSRAKHRGGDKEDRFERRGLDFHRALREGFLDIARRDPARCRVVDSAKPVDEVTADVWAAVSPVLA
ncbi:MAG: dTMP kinase [Hyphomicrobiales bacterium]